jgi:hypothetical protein
MNRVVGRARNLIGTLNGAAGFDDSRENSQANVQENCGKIAAGQLAGLLVPGPTGSLVQATLLDTINFYMGRAREVDAEKLSLAYYLDPQIIRLISDIESGGYFRLFGTQLMPMWART